MTKPFFNTFVVRARARKGATAVASALAAVPLVAGACGSSSSPHAAPAGGASSQPASIQILAFQSPSLGAFLPAVIKSQHLDTAHGLNLQYKYTTPDDYYAEMASGHYQVGASAGLLTEGLQRTKGIPLTFLFDMFDYYGAVVTSNPSITNLKSLEGHSLAAATGTSNFAMFKWFAKQDGVDLSKISTQNQTTGGLSTMAITGRTDATELWEPAYSTLLTEKPSLRTLDMGLPGEWKQAFGTTEIPYLGVSANSSWASSHGQEIKELYATYQTAAAWVTSHASQAASIIAATIPHGSASVIQTLIKNNQRLAMHVVAADQISGPINDVFKAGVDIGYLKSMPPAAIVYRGL